MLHLHTQKEERNENVSFASYITPQALNLIGTKIKIKIVKIENFCILLKHSNLSGVVSNSVL